MAKALRPYFFSPLLSYSFAENDHHFWNGEAREVREAVGESPAAFCFIILCTRYIVQSIKYT